MVGRRLLLLVLVGRHLHMYSCAHFGLIIFLFGYDLCAAFFLLVISSKRQRIENTCRSCRAVYSGVSVRRKREVLALELQHLLNYSEYPDMLSKLTNQIITVLIVRAGSGTCC